MTGLRQRSEPRQQLRNALEGLGLARSAARSLDKMHVEKVSFITTRRAALPCISQPNLFFAIPNELTASENVPFPLDSPPA
jgi:hypothetical protein